MSCATEDIKINLGVNICDEPLAKGVGETVFIGRFSWLSTSAPDSTNKKIIRSITLKSGKKLLRFIGRNFSNQIGTSLTTGEYGNNVVQTLRYILFGNSAAEEAQLDALLDLKDVFAIVKKNGNPGSWKIVGWKTGLRLTTLDSDSNDDTLKGAYTLQMQAPDEKSTFYTFQHMTSGGSPVDDTDDFIETLALALS
ncbi:hypothetical protein IC229_27455 [Spirosoma sp. BT702]|uniref:Uncharacterized protein n=1 Tax=Spirosoma profusum TaxID=2771354 RepID=A0A926Y0M1_9BACT|nr:hypothetical protein [Spirosoma profusum]MBD2704408.1 hypothetical protein [Spirosoma profusum]